MLFNIDSKAFNVLVRSEFKRWGIQFLVMVGAVPYVIGMGHILSFPLRFIDVPKNFDWVGNWVMLLVFISYYLISLKLHLVFDKKRTFSRSLLLSIRPYLTIPLVIQAVWFWGDFLNVATEIQNAIRQIFEPIGNFSFPMLLLSSVLLTWLLSEWVCRFRRWRGHHDFFFSIDKPEKSESNVN